jgi:hypothetical protein
VSADGTLAACRRIEAGCWRTKTDRNGTPVYLHRLDGSDKPLSPPPPSPACRAVERADPDTLSRVYGALLAHLTLGKAHRDNLERRGPPGQPLVPVRDLTGRVLALLVRREGEGSGKYVWVSSAKDGGPGPGSPVHVPLGVGGPAEVVRVTEGALKADVAHTLSGLPTIGLPGVSTWWPALPVLRELGAKTVRLALDADAKDKPPVARALAALAENLAAEGLAVELERWPGEYKGIDDALAAGAAVEVLAGDRVRQAIAEIVAAAGLPPRQPTPPRCRRGTLTFALTWRAGT